MKSHAILPRSSSYQMYDNMVNENMSFGKTGIISSFRAIYSTDFSGQNNVELQNSFKPEFRYEGYYDNLANNYNQYSAKSGEDDPIMNAIEKTGDAINNAAEKFTDELMFLVEMYGASIDFYRNYSDMKEANWLNSDKYFHAKANFFAAHRGPGGVYFAIHFSNLREIWDQNIMGYPRSDSVLDQKANSFGREQAKSYAPDQFMDALGIYRPKKLPLTY